MNAATPPDNIQTNIRALAIELEVLRTLLVTLSLQLTDIQFESDGHLRGLAKSQTDQLLRVFRSRCT
jgi:hypothetical protein